MSKYSFALLVAAALFTGACASVQGSVGTPNISLGFTEPAFSNYGDRGR
ncbi:MAG: hypothetical protein AAFN79_01945 [Pseudomonadota bacterium]